MKHFLARAGVLALTAGVLLVTPTAAQAETEVVVFKNQITQPDTRAGGHITWPLGGGIRMSTDSNTSQDKATFAFSVAASQGLELGTDEVSHDVNIRAGGPVAEPGIQIALDTSGGPETDSTLVWESVYGGDDVWLTNGSNIQLRRIAPSCDGDESLTALTSDQAIASGHCTGGSGSAWHGSEDDWAAALVANGYNPAILGLGESLGSGVFGNVLVTSITAGETVFTFSRANAPAPQPTVVDPTTRVQVTVTTSCRQAVFEATLPAPGPNEVYSQNAVGYRFVSAGSTVERSTVTVGQTKTKTVIFTKSTTNVPRVKTFKTAPGQAATGYPNVPVQDKGVNRNCNTVGAPTP